MDKACSGCACKVGSHFYVAVGTTSLGEKSICFSDVPCRFLWDCSKDKTFSDSIGTTQIYGDVGGA